MLNLFFPIYCYVLRQRLTDGRTLCATTSPSTSASWRWKTKTATRLGRAVCGLSIQPRWRRCRMSWTSGVAKTPSLSAEAWRGQVQVPHAKHEPLFCLAFKQNLMQTFPPQNALITCWERNQTSSSLCPLTTTMHCYPDWHLLIEPPHPRALQLCFSHPAYPLSLRSILTFSLSSPATLLLLLLTPATHLPCTPPSASQLPPEAWTPPWLQRCHPCIMLPCRPSTVLGQEACRTFCWRETPVMTSTCSTPVWLTCSCKVETHDEQRTNKRFVFISF